MSSLNALKEVLRPPNIPCETPDSSDWQLVETSLGMGLPEDYKDFISCYGTGAVDQFLWVLNPFSNNKYLNLLDAGSAQLEVLRQLRDDFGENIPYPLGSDSNGLYPWAITDNGDVLYWLCNGVPSDWLIVVNEARAPCWREFKCSMSEFLARLITRELIVDIFPDDFPSESPKFVPAA